MRNAISTWPVNSWVTLNRVRSFLVLVRQREDVQCVTAQWVAYVWRDYGRNIPWATAAEACRNSDVLLAVDAEGQGKPLNRRPKPDLPKNGPGLHIDCF